MSAPKPIDGTAIVLHLIEAARALAHGDRLHDPEGVALVAWVTELEDRFEREKHDSAPAGWQPRRWRELVAGDQVEVGGQVATIAGVGWEFHGHVDPERYAYHPGIGNDVDENPCRSCKGACRETRGRKYQPLEHSYVPIRLEGRDPLYQMPPDGEVETLRGPAGQALDEVNGYRSMVPGAEPIDVLGSWVAEAAQTLEAAGLGPVEVMSIKEGA